VSSEYAWTECGRIYASPPQVAARYTADGSLVLTDESSRVMLRGPGEHAPVRRIAGSARSFALSLDGSLLAIPALGGVELREVAEGDVKATLSPPATACPSEHVRLSPTADLAMTYGATGICAWRVDGSRFLTHISGVVSSAAFHDDTIVAVVVPSDTPSAKPAIVRYDLAGAEIGRPALAKLADGFSLSAWATVSPEGSKIAATASSAAGFSPLLFSAESGELLWQAEPDPEARSAVFSPAGDFVLMGGVFRVGDGTPLWQTPWVTSFPGSPAVAEDALALSPDGEEITARFGPHFASVRRGEALPRSLAAHTFDPGGRGVNPLRSLALTPDGATLLSVGREALRWQLAPSFADSSPSLVLTSTPYLSRAEISPDGRWAAFAGDGRFVQSLENPGKVSFPAPAPVTDDQGLCVWLQFRFSPDGQWLLGSSYDHALELYQVADLGSFSGMGASPAPVWQSGETGCPTLAALPRGLPAPITNDHQDASDWPALRGEGQAPSFGRGPFDDLVIAPDGNDAIASGHCRAVIDDLGATEQCFTQPSSDRWEALPEQMAPYPAFSPEGNWVVAGPTLVHLPTGETRVFDADARVAIFTPEGDIIAGERSGDLARYCRSTP
jgi:WD40 repeat protein